MQECVEPHEIAVVNINGEEATLKRIHAIDGQAVLQASNPAYHSRVYPVDDIRIVGRVIRAMVKF